MAGCDWAVGATASGAGATGCWVGLGCSDDDAKVDPVGSLILDTEPRDSRRGGRLANRGRLGVALVLLALVNGKMAEHL
jgi:hypothetical protein